MLGVTSKPGVLLSTVEAAGLHPWTELWVIEQGPSCRPSDSERRHLFLIING